MMEQEPRKATDVLLQLESKVDSLVTIIQTLDFNIKVLSNKLNEIMKSLDKQQAPPKIVVEAVQAPLHNPEAQAVTWAQPLRVDPERAIPITAADKLPQVDTSQGFRRTSRPETYAKEAQQMQPPVPTQSLPNVQFPSHTPKPPPGRSVGETVVAPPAVKAKPMETMPDEQLQVSASEMHHVIPVEQRVVDRNGKSVFLADVEVINVLNGEQVNKTRTNGMGKWMAPLPVGTYQVTIRKHESVTKTKVEATQTIKVDGLQSPLKLQTVIIK
jgi:hypothetical protein